MDPVTSTVGGTIISALSGLFGFLYKRQAARIDELANCTVKTKIQLEKRPTSTDVRALISDKIAPVQVTLKEIHEDVREIKQDIKEMRK